MKTKILEASGEELSRLAGELLGSNKLHRHNPRDIGEGVYQCVYCNKVGFQKDTEDNSETCPVGYPIPLTPDNAFKWRDWAVEKFGFVNFRWSMEEVHYQDDKARGFTTWLATHADPIHYIKAACLCKLDEK